MVMHGQDISPTSLPPEWSRGTNYTGGRVSPDLTWTCVERIKYLASTRVWAPNRPAWGKLLYRMRYLGPPPPPQQQQQQQQQHILNETVKENSNNKQANNIVMHFALMKLLLLSENQIFSSQCCSHTFSDWFLHHSLSVWSHNSDCYLFL